MQHRFGWIVSYSFLHFLQLQNEKKTIKKRWINCTLFKWLYAFVSWTVLMDNRCMKTNAMSMRWTDVSTELTVRFKQLIILNQKKNKRLNILEFIIINFSYYKKCLWYVLHVSIFLYYRIEHLKDLSNSNCNGSTPNLGRVFLSVCNDDNWT